MSDRPDRSASQGRVSQRIRIVNRRGLHARAAAKFVKLAGEFESEITVEHDDVTVSGVSIMGLLTLAAAMGTEIVVTAEGPDAECAVTALSALVAMGFGEEPGV